MDFINVLGLAMPENNFWATLINIFDVGSYVWAILIFTVVLKLVLSPLDFLQRFYTNKSMRAQAKIAPELEKLKRQYGNNTMLLQKKQTELYSKNNVSMKGSCIVMLVYMAVTLVVFLTLFSSLRTISSFKIKNQFENLQTTYNNNYNTNFEDYLSTFNASTTEYYLKETDEEKLEYLAQQYVLQFSVSEDEAKTEISNQLEAFVSNAQDKVVLTYNEIKDSWLWVKNIWRSDKPTKNAILNYNDFVNETKYNISEQNYNLVMAKLLNNSEINSANGYYILSVVVVLVSLLSQFLSRKLSGQNKAQAGGGASKILMFILPLAMLMFTLNSSALFSVYIITNSLVSAILMPIISKLSNKIEDKIEKDKKNKNKASYSR